MVSKPNRNSEKVRLIAMWLHINNNNKKKRKQKYDVNFIELYK